ncbi:hypothetical protein [Pseudochelatococcus contaminans]|uniref:Bacteriophage protein n=1 Tax=Pseudochelatococcus contaminans TaxID=1538103 RepID=A0A7W5Z349_9HYPH|nr:hypothetical protein [Pseudochelatococcus contaminans]MBB3808756.1 hypothetical protein [Pseudochelatococcus contaminans]
MPLLDVSDILNDPMFADELAVTRVTQSVDSHGRVKETSQTTTISGVVTADTGDILDRIDTGSRLKGSIMVHTQFQLTAGYGDVAADILSWNGRSYTVSNVNDYSRYGAGFVAATCDLISP